MEEQEKKEVKQSPERSEEQSPERSKGESPEDKFKRLASLRTQNALKKIKLLGNLSGPGYKCTEEQINKIISALRSAVDEVEARFKKQEAKENGFTL